MDLKDLRASVKRWDLGNATDLPEATSKFQSILDRLEWFGATEWADYLPSQHPDFSANYLVRLAKWIGNVQQEQDRQLLIEYALHVAFFSHLDWCSLYSTAFSGPVTRWVVEQATLSLDDPHFQAHLGEELYQRTWYCPVTDSMDINEFYHANHIVGVSHRPGFALLKMLDQVVQDEPPDAGMRLRKNLESYIESPGRDHAYGLQRLVLLEDFVGSGVQTAGALKWAAKNIDLPILFVPLVICAPGLTKLANDLKSHREKIRISPMLELTEGELLGKNRNGAEGIPNAERIEELALSTFEKVAGSPHTDERIPPHTAFGFMSTGSSFVSYSNSPNNTLPMIHHRPKTAGWYPLFPRSARV